MMSPDDRKMFAPLRHRESISPEAKLVAILSRHEANWRDPRQPGRGGKGRADPGWPVPRRPRQTVKPRASHARSPLRVEDAEETPHDACYLLVLISTSTRR